MRRGRGRDPLQRRVVERAAAPRGPDAARRAASRSARRCRCPPGRAGRAARCRWRSRGRGARSRRAAAAGSKSSSSTSPPRRRRPGWSDSWAGVSSSSTGPSRSTARMPAPRSSSQIRARRAAQRGRLRRDPEPAGHAQVDVQDEAVARTTAAGACRAPRSVASAWPASRSGMRSAAWRGCGVAIAGTVPTSGCSRCAMRSIVSPSGIGSYDRHSVRLLRPGKIISLAILVAIVGGVWWAWGRLHRSEPASRSAALGAVRDAKGEAAKIPVAGVYCTRGGRRANRSRAALRRAQASDRPAARRHPVAELAVRRPARLDRPQRGLADPDQRGRRQGHRPHHPRRHPRLLARGDGQRRAARAAAPGEDEEGPRLVVDLQGRRDRLPPRLEVLDRAP